MKTIDDVIEVNKKPWTLKDNYVGIEIEFVTEFGIEGVAQMILLRKLDSYCSVADDGSIDPMVRNEHTHTDETGTYEEYDEYGEGVELRVLCKERELISVMARVNSLLKACKAEVNNSCGLHVHIDMRNRDAYKSTVNLLKKQKSMFKMMPESRKNNHYCRATDLTYKQVHDVLVGKIPEGRRAAINITAFHKHKTIEVRLHEGTVNIKDIINWTKYLIQVVDNKKHTKGIKAYAKKRIETFNTKVG